MILQALKEYYDRKPDLPRSGFELKEIPFVIVLDSEGLPVSLNDTREGLGKSRRAKPFLVPQSVKRSVGIVANLLWDSPEYALGVVLKGNDKRVADLHKSFRRRVDSLGIRRNPAVRAMCAFLDRTDKLELLSAFGETWDLLKKTGGNVSFQLAGQAGLIVEQPEIRAEIAAAVSGDADSLCIVTGAKDTVERLHTAIKGVWGAQSSGANIVSFNLDAFVSFGKRQGENAPVGKAAAFAYTTALNHLLSKDSSQRIQVGDASTVFWSARGSSLETDFASLFSEPPKDDPDRCVRAVASLLRSVETGVLEKSDSGNRFYVLGLSPNASRIAVRFWIADTVPVLAKRFCRYFEDIRIVHSPHERDALSLFRLLVSTAVLGKSENIPPNVAGETMRAILEGLPFPQTLLASVIRRIRAEHEITHPRAALIKASLNRVQRFRKSTQTEDMKVSLDTSNTNVGYRLGRLFAALEKIQSEASPGINATIRDKFYGAASSTPVTVFGNLMRLKNHHLAKLENAGRRVNLERLIGEIVSGIQDFPPHLALDDQGRFAIGYYHQMQDLFTKKTDKDGKED